jgi:alpha-amylase/alpha-mannosidase (GH57 family)
VSETSPLKVLFIWHHHQPYYKTDGTFLLPWVRMHGIKDYWDMVRILDDFPGIKQTFNFAPSLLEQLQDYLSQKDQFGEGGTTDVAYLLSLKNPDSFTPEDKLQAMRTFFGANTERMIKRYPRYSELLGKRGIVRNDNDIENSINNFDSQDFRDLQVWWNLSWVGEYSRFDPPFKYYLDKQRNFSEDEKLDLLKSQLAILRKIIPHHIEAANRGQIEISASPFYHPILPLLCDTNSGMEANADTRLPDTRFRHPEDAHEQVESGLAYASKIFGARPKGMWPSEGSLSDATLEIMTKNKVAWTATDELILQKTLLNAGKGINGDFIQKYFAYDFDKDGNHIKIFFRDHGLSDLIGFVYSQWNPDDAANDLVTRLLKIRESIAANFDERTRAYAIVPIILDGENAWEFYQSDGKDFLRTLYHKLSNEPRIQTVLPSDVKVKHGNSLKHISPGSWINGDFKIWIGHPEDNKAWDYLSQARAAFEKLSQKKTSSERSRAYREIKIAEGSDWCWWYGDDHRSSQAYQFDNLFRYHLKQVYTLLGTNPPAELDEPIKKQSEPFYRQAARMISPKFDEQDHDKEWKDAGFVEEGGGSMQKTGAVVKRLYFCNDMSSYYLRIDTAKEISIERIVIEFQSNHKIRLEIAKDFTIRTEGSLKDFEFAGHYLVSDTIQIAISFGKIRPGEVDLTVSIYDGNKLVDLFPSQGTAKFKVVQ